MYPHLGDLSCTTPQCCLSDEETKQTCIKAYQATKKVILYPSLLFSYTLITWSGALEFELRVNLPFF